MSTTATPPGNGPAPVIEPTVTQPPPNHGPGPRDIPPPTGRGHWYRRGWVIALGALLVGIVIGVSGGSTKSPPRAATVTAPAQTVVQTVPGPTTTVVHVRKVPGPTRTVTQTVQASTPTQATPSGGSGQSFSGNGGKSLGTITVANDSTLTWTNDGGLFTLNDDSYGIYVNSQGHSGTTAVSAGTYKNVGVNAVGNWTVTISPG
jgi:hypothetical protein